VQVRPSRASRPGESECWHNYYYYDQVMPVVPSRRLAGLWHDSQNEAEGGSSNDKEDRHVTE
jgi:hypothetical protein